MNLDRKLDNILDSGEFIEATLALEYEKDENLLRNIAMVLSLAGVNSFDISANLSSIKCLREGINDAIEISKSLKQEINHIPYIKVSIGLLDPQSDEPYFLGSASDVKKNISQCIEAGSEIIEFHLGNMSEEEFLQLWESINEVSSNHYVSINLNRVFQSNAHLVNLVNRAYEVNKENVIIQIDGATSEGEDEDYSSTLQSLATADILIKELKIKDRKKFKKMKITLCGDMNTKTRALALICGIDYSGLSIGHHHKVSNFDFLHSKISGIELVENPDELQKAVHEAKNYLSKFSVIR